MWKKNEDDSETLADRKEAKKNSFSRLCEDAGYVIFVKTVYCFPVIARTNDCKLSGLMQLGFVILQFRRSENEMDFTGLKSVYQWGCVFLVPLGENLCPCSPSTPPQLLEAAFILCVKAPSSLFKGRIVTF